MKITPAPLLGLALLVSLHCGFARAHQPLKAIGSLEVAFSPSEGAEELAIRVIEAAKVDIKVLAYSFTSAPITRALLAARKRGVLVSVVADEKSNLGGGPGGQKAKAAFSALANAGCDIRTISVYAIAHDKTIVVDGTHTLTGSMNFSASAESRNSENVLVNWNNTGLAAIYTQHFIRNYRQSRSFVPY